MFRYIFNHDEDIDICMQIARDRKLIKVSQVQDKHVVDMSAVIKEEITSSKSDFTEKIDLLEGKLRDKDQRIENLESKIHPLENKRPAEETTEVKQFPIGKIMVVLKMPFEVREDIRAKVAALLAEMKAPQEANVVRVARLSPMGNLTKPVVKVEFNSMCSRDMVLKCGRNLKNSSLFRGVFARASLSEKERQNNRN